MQNILVGIGRMNSEKKLIYLETEVFKPKVTSLVRIKNTMC